MAQITHGVRAILSHPLVYSAFQSLMGAHRFRTNFVSHYVKPFSGMRILDIGCGPADILAYLPNVDYSGFDISQAYIDKARSKFGQQGHFYCQHLRPDDVENLPKFDVVLAIGLLHHLDDPLAISVMRLAHQALKPGGKLLTVDPCLDPSQNAMAGFLVRHDRGQNVRNKLGYSALAANVFVNASVEVRHQRWIPYTHCIMECTKL